MSTWVEGSWPIHAEVHQALSGAAETKLQKDLQAVREGKEKHHKKVDCTAETSATD